MVKYQRQVIIKSNCEGFVQPKALAKLSNKVGFNVPTLLDPTLLDRLTAHVG